MIVLGAGAAHADNLPTRFQYTEFRYQSGGNRCEVLNEVRIQGNLVLLAPLRKTCTDEDNEFDGDEGYVFPLNGQEAYERQCDMGVGYEPKISCSDGEVFSARGFTSTEPLRIDGNISRVARWDGTRLELAQKDFEARYTRAGGSSSKTVKIKTDYFLRFSFADGTCTLETIQRSRLRMVGKRANQMVGAIEPRGCTILQ